MKNQKLKIINEFEFLKDKGLNYHYRYPAIVSIQIGNTVEQIKVKAENEVNENYQERFKETVTEKLQTIIDVGINFDYIPIFKKYDIELAKIKIIEVEEKKQNKIRTYKKSWIHKFKKEAEELHEKIEIKIPTLEQVLSYSNWTNSSLDVIYRASKYNITLDQIGGDVRGGGILKYCWEPSFSNRRRSSLKVKTIIDGVIKYTDEQIKFTIEKKIRLKKEEGMNNDKLTFLQKEFPSYTIIKDKESKWHSGLKRTLYTTRYYITNEFRKTSIAFRIKDEINIFSLGSFSELSKEEVEKILKILF